MFAPPADPRVEVGGLPRALLTTAASDVRVEEVDGRRSFHRIAAANAGVRLPLRVAGDGEVRWRLRPTVRSSVSAFLGGRACGEAILDAGRWAEVRCPFEGGTATIDLAVAAQPRPLVRGDHGGALQLAMGPVEVTQGTARASLGTALLAAGAAGLLVGLAVAGGLPPAGVVLGAVTMAGAAGVAARAAPVELGLALPRLVFPAVLVAAASAWAVRRPGPRHARGGLVLLVAAAAIGHGLLAFVPGFAPNDLAIHAARTVDLASVPLDYEALRRYASHLPTTTQPYGGADLALGSATLLPYSPVPYLAFAALRAGGLDLWWAIPVFTTLLAAAVIPSVFATAARLWDEETAWTAALLYALDLAVWHHVARAHAPAAFGGALATLVLLAFCTGASRLAEPRAVSWAGAAVAAALLAYSSLPVLLGAFGAALLVLVAADARSWPPRARAGAVGALLLGAAGAFVLYYGHYAAGLVSGTRALEAAPDAVKSYAFGPFRNEGRPALRVWHAGFWAWVAAGLLAAPWALRRARAEARPVLLAWLAAWALVMVLKDPLVLPKLLRWAKEDQFLSPLLALLVAAAASAPTSRPVRRALQGAALAGALAIQLRDWLAHAAGRLAL